MKNVTKPNNETNGKKKWPMRMFFLCVFLFIYLFVKKCLYYYTQNISMYKKERLVQVRLLLITYGVEKKKRKTHKTDNNKNKKKHKKNQWSLKWARLTK